MFARRLSAIAMLALGLGVAGCAARTCYHPCRVGMDAPRQVSDVLPVAELRPMLPDAAELDLQGPRHEPRELSYYTLSAEACQCLAVRHSSLGNLLDAERRSVRAGADGQDPGIGMKLGALNDAAREARNRSAGAALEIYYSLAGGEAKRQLIEQALDELAAAQEDVAELRAQGLEVPFDDTSFARRVTELEAQLVEIELTLAEGNRELIKLVGLAPAAEVRIWPADALLVDTSPRDVEQEVQLGLRLRPQLQGVYHLAHRLNTSSLDVSRRLLGGMNGMLGISPAVARRVACLLSHADSQAASEVAARRAQLMQYANDLERDTADEIRQAVAAIGERLRIAALEQELVGQWEARLDDLQALQEIDKASFVDIARARLDQLDAESKLVDALVECQKAHVSLRQSQGLLVAECEGAGCGPTWLPHNSTSLPAVPAEEAVPPPPGQSSDELPMPPLPVAPPEPPRIDAATLDGAEPLAHDGAQVTSFVDEPPAPPQSIARRLRHALFSSPPLPRAAADPRRFGR